jgi:hypothetical protein
MAAKRRGSDEEVRVVGERFITELLYTLGGQGSPLRGNGVGALQVSGRIRATICTDRRPEALFPVLCALCSVLCALFFVLRSGARASHGGGASWVSDCESPLSTVRGGVR